ncbi:MAG: DUF4342 domain-containing protein [Clostridium sp.]|uniref:DUF4342 domain-containing protein n=1 Tax=Clostridium sp. TaxID=1506 RepID=UPI002FCBB59B
MQETTLEKIDIIRQRFGVSYEEAKAALEENNNDLVETLIYMEKNKKGFSEVMSEKSNDLVDTIKEIIKQGNVNRIKVKRNGKVLVDIPVTAGVAAGALSVMYLPLLAIGAVTAIAADLKIEIERENGEVEVLSHIVKKNSSKFSDKFNKLTKGAKTKTESFVNKAMDKTKTTVDNMEETMIEIKNKSNNK